jgi:hypothetical protein
MSCFVNVQYRMDLSSHLHSDRCVSEYLSDWMLDGCSWGNEKFSAPAGEQIRAPRS